MTEAEDSRSHYAAVAGSYTDCYFYQEGGEMEQWRVEVILARLKSFSFSPQNYRVAHCTLDRDVCSVYCW